MRIPISEDLFGDSELTQVDVELERETVECLQQAARRRDITFDQMLRYLINIGMDHVAVDPDAELSSRSSTDAGESPANSPRSSARPVEDASHETVIDRFREAKKRLDELEQRRDAIRDSDRQQLYERLMSLKSPANDAAPDDPATSQADDGARTSPPSMFDLASNDDSSEASS
jgi:hypothetical protein